MNTDVARVRRLTPPSNVRGTTARCCWLLAWIPFVFCSCEGQGERVPTYPVSGRVLYDGKPAEGALVIFNRVGASAQEQIVPQGTVQADGSFQLTTYESHDGAPEGPYSVTIRWPEPPASPLDPPDMGEDRLKGRYINASNSPWQITVEPRENVLEPFVIEAS